ncbi:methylated-DNA--[protein]-cysteine S-methyltransferase [Aquibacillus koreensis]|uniref:methylated-DNA--[protein]-cysteine S-methyltransferase n=1 Tax=Aquibacillus koreensis TaxID=279446 RepID=UPI002340729E|nr:methylated-DNA--[protein]-cysteine S-methyltransferase [Aquibacillus koreensis]
MENRSQLFYEELETPIGSMTIIMSHQGVCRIDFGGMARISLSLKAWSKRYFLTTTFVENPSRTAALKQQLHEYFHEGRKTFDVAFDLHGTTFQQKVWKCLLEDVPYGETRSYKDIAQCIQAPKAIRAVGGAINKNPLAIVIPCHRVIGSNGSLVGYNGGMEKKKQLLLLEKALVEV